MTETLSHAIARRVLHLNPTYMVPRTDVPPETIDALITGAAWKILFQEKRRMQTQEHNTRLN